MNIGIHLVTLILCCVASASRQKLRHLATTVEVSSEKDCHLNTRGKHIMKLPDGSFICKYRGKYYAFGQSWIDPTRCLQCICLGASGIACCKIELKPVMMPKRCEVHPYPEYSKVPRLAACMAPIVTKRSKRKMCTSRRLYNAFHNTRWVRVSGQEGQKVYLRAVKRKKGNNVR